MMYMMCTLTAVGITVGERCS